MTENNVCSGERNLSPVFLIFDFDTLVVDKRNQDDAKFAFFTKGYSKRLSNLVSRKIFQRLGELPKEGVVMGVFVNTKHCHEQDIAVGLLEADIADHFTRELSDGNKEIVGYMEARAGTFEEGFSEFKDNLTKVYGKGHFI